MIYHILIVDDETAIKKGLSMLIQKDLPNCVIDGTASDGAEAMEMVKQSVPDIVITDIKMPVCDGLALSKFLFEHYPNVKIIMLTGFADFDFARTAIKYRVSEYLLKPTSKEKLVEAITRIQEEIMDFRRRNSFLEKNSALFLERILQETASGANKDAYSDTLLSCWPDGDPPYRCIAFQCRHSDAKEKNQLSLIRSILEQQLPHAFLFRYRNAVNCLYFKSSEEDRDESCILSFAQEIVNLSKLLYGVSVSSGISQEKFSPNEISSASLEAYSSLLSNFFCSQDVSLYDPAAVPSSQFPETVYSKTLFELENAIGEQDYSESMDLILKIFNSLRANLVSSEQVKYICGQIYYILIRGLLHRGTAEASTEFLDFLEHSAKAEDLQNYLLQLLDQLRVSAAQSAKQMSQMTRQAAAYITLHLSEDLALETIADAVNANPSYLSRIFKKECGETLTEYITRMRIEKAKELLLSDYLIYQTAEAVGFRDPAYFSTIFKKYTGISPKEFKQKYKRPAHPRIN